MFQEDEEKEIPFRGGYQPGNDDKRGYQPIIENKATPQGSSPPVGGDAASSSGKAKEE